MTIWIPKMAANDVPIYRRIAGQLERDITEGVLLPGSRLPTQRELAHRLGITVATVTRAYTEAAERGLIESTVGRGSFVRDVRRTPTHAYNGRPTRTIDLSTNVIAAPGATPLPVARLASLLESQSYGIDGGSERHRAAGAGWVAAIRPDATPDMVLVTTGAQQAMHLTFAALTRPGDTVMTEHVTYHGMKAAAALLHIKLEPLPIDRWGMTPEGLERAAKKRPRGMVYVTPTLHNPTGSVMPEKRRRELAAIAEKHDLTVVEDDVYGFLVAEAPRALTSYIPDRGLLVTSVSKSLGPSLRTGFLIAPPPLREKIETALRASTLFTSPLGAEIAATWIEDGTARRLVAAKRSAVAARRRLAQQILGERAGHAAPQSPHLWIELPRRWTADALADEARQRGVRIATANSFTVGGEPPHAIRLSIAAPALPAELEMALGIVIGLVDRGMTSASVV